MATPKFRKYYVRGSILPFEEDQTHEFKGHLNLSMEEIPYFARASEIKNEKASRKPGSRNINGFLNSGLGGTLYFGVIDSGKVFGINMTRLQKAHFLASLDDLMGRYNPPVLSHQYSVRFIPVVDSKSTQEEIVRLLQHISSEELTEEEKERKHLLRTNLFCWCHKDASARHNSGVATTDFVVELVIKAWDDYDPRNPSLGEDKLLRIRPYYASEEGKIYFRKQASLIEYPLCDLVRMTRDEVRQTYENETARLRQMYEELLRRETDNG